jgi:UDP-glucose 4-epimerase
LRAFVAGGAGFIGSHLVDRLISTSSAIITVYDRFSSGRMWHLEPHLKSPRVQIVRADIKDLKTLTAAMRGHDVVYHFASNPDIAKAGEHPDTDFWEGTYLTQNTLEAMRVNGVQKIIYASGSGVYGDTGETPVTESYAPMLPISTYGASKLAGEALICAYCHMFDMMGRAYRFANVVGPRQTHGVGFDFVRRLRQDPTRLHILGDGKQSKSYIHVEDVLDAIAWTDERSLERFDVFNVATDDYITVTEIANLAIETLGLSLDCVELTYTGGPRGWKGDVPVVRFDLTRIHSMGWRAKRTSRQALWDAMQAILLEASEHGVGTWGHDNGCTKRGGGKVG